MTEQEQPGTEPAPQVVARAARVRLIAFDVDGVLTDGAIRYASDGTDARAFHARDGHGIHVAQEAGLRFAIVSGRRSTVVERRAAELSIDEVHQGVRRKGACLEEILARLGLPGEAACFVGDDLIDVPAMRRSGFAVAPADAVPEVRAAAHLVTRRAGGRGAVREVIDLVLRASGRWARVAEQFEL